METTEVMKGKKIGRFFENLKKDRSVIKMHLLGQNYERLTMIIGVMDKKEPFFFNIDYPGEFESAVNNSEPWKIRFEYLGEDKVIYRFRTLGGDIAGGDISIPFPETIERIQRRGRFRMEAPPSSKLVVPDSANSYQLSVINLSESGILVEMDRETVNKRDFQVGEYLQKLAILVTEPEENAQINIKEALVKRVEKLPGNPSYRYALQFTELKPDTKRELRDIMYRFQRNFLKKRQTEEE